MHEPEWYENIDEMERFPSIFNNGVLGHLRQRIDDVQIPYVSVGVKMETVRTPIVPRRDPFLMQMPTETETQTSKGQDQDPDLWEAEPDYSPNPKGKGKLKGKAKTHGLGSRRRVPRQGKAGVPGREREQERERGQGRGDFAFDAAFDPALDDYHQQQFMRRATTQEKEKEVPFLQGTLFGNTNIANTARYQQNEYSGSYIPGLPLPTCAPTSPPDVVGPAPAPVTVIDNANIRRSLTDSFEAEAIGPR